MAAHADIRTEWGLVGHEWAVHALARSIASDHMAHAYLLTGPHAIGKTTLARKLAQVLECHSNNRPCGECPACKKIERNRHPDVQIIEGVPVGYKFDEKSAPDALSRGGIKRHSDSGLSRDNALPPPRANDWERRILKIDQIRAIQHDVSRSPFEGRWKIIILRRFEEANEEAANAFLKTLEEPPRHARLILTARDASLLLPTIPSRCQIFALRPLAPALAEAALIERWGVEPATARLLARLSGGRLGWAIRANANPAMLDTRRTHLAALDAVLHEGRAERLNRAGNLAKETDDLPEMLELWLGWWRDVLLTQNADEARITNVDYTQALREQSARISVEQVQRALKSTRTTARYLAQNVNPRLALEVLLLNLPGV